MIKSIIVQYYLQAEYLSTLQCHGRNVRAHSAQGHDHAEWETWPNIWVSNDACGASLER